MSRAPSGSQVEFRWSADRKARAVSATARCEECERRVECALDAAAIVGYSVNDDPGRDAQARAQLTRACLVALRDEGCLHAIHDRAALVDCILRPDRARLPAVLAALFDTSEAAARAVLSARGFSATWKSDELSIAWTSGGAEAFEDAVSPTRRGTIATASVTMAAAEAWELIVSRGLVPVDWLGSDARAFRAQVPQAIGRARLPANVARYRAAERAAPTVATVRDRATSAPSTLRGCVAIAADCTGAMATEALVREVLVRLAPWGVERLRRISWRTVDASQWRTERQSYWSESLRATIASVLRETPFALPPGYGPTDAPPRPSWWALAAAESTLAKLWSELSVTGVTRPDGIDGVRLRDFKALANPYEPLIAIWSTGFIFDALIHGEAVLVASEW